MDKRSYYLIIGSIVLLLAAIIFVNKCNNKPTEAEKNKEVVEQDRKDVDELILEGDSSDIREQERLRHKVLTQQQIDSIEKAVRNEVKETSKSIDSKPSVSDRKLLDGLQSKLSKPDTLIWTEEAD